MAMARTVAELPKGVRITDYISIGVLAKAIPLAAVRRVLAETGRASQRERLCPAHVMVYYVVFLALFMDTSCREVYWDLLEGLLWVFRRDLGAEAASRGGLSRARVRLGCEPVERLYRELVGPVAVREGPRRTRGAWYRDWRVVTWDGSTLDVADTEANDAAFGRPSASRGRSGFPQVRFVALVENGTHVMFGAQLGGCHTGETTLAVEMLGLLRPDMLLLADRLFFSYALWRRARQSQAALVWRVKCGQRFPCLKRLADGSYLSKIYPSDKDRRHDQNGIVVRVVEYTIDGKADDEPFYRLITTLVDPEQAPAAELAALYHERWEIENTLDEFKTHLRGPRVVLRSKRPDLVRQEFFGFLLAHFAVRGLIHESALVADEDPDELSFLHAVRVIQRKLPTFGAFPPSGLADLA